MRLFKTKKYVSPHLLMVECYVEHGFANTLEDPSIDPEIDW